MDWVWWIVSEIPGADEVLKTMSTGTPIEMVKTIAALAIAVIIGFAGSAEVIRWLLKWGFKKKSRMVVQLEGLEALLAGLHKEAASLREEKKLSDRRFAEEMAKQPQAAIARAEKEMRDRNDISVIHHLEEWFKLNAPSIGAIALRLARYHIAQALPEPGDHLRRADQMLRLARGATPGDQEAREIFNEFSQVNAALQEQTIRAGDEVIAWNSTMGQGSNARGERMLPLIVTFRKVAAYCHEKGFPRLTPLFADRAADLARQGGAPLRKVWFQVEPLAIIYQTVAGHYETALDRIDHVLAEARIHLADRDSDALNARYRRASVLRDLGRPAEALAEIDAFVPIMAEVTSARHWYTPATQSLRIGIEIAESRNTDHGAALTDIAASLTKELGTAARQTQLARYRLARLWICQGREAEAAQELRAVIASFDPQTDPTYRLLQSARALLAVADGGAPASGLVT